MLAAPVRVAPAVKHQAATLLALTLVLCASSVLVADDVDEFVKATLQARHIPGASIAVIRNGIVVKAEGYGLADLEHGVAARPDNGYKIGSVSKQFIAAAILLLAQDGRLRVDDKVSAYLPGTPSTWQDITIRHALTHTAGMVREPPGFDSLRPVADRELITRAFALPLRSKPGDRYEYSNLGYYVLAEVITVVSGRPWPDFMTERIFAPLGMTATRTTTAFEVVANRAGGYVWRAEKFILADDYITVRPSGAFLSTVLDMAKWEAALQTERLLTDESKTQMWTPVALNGGQRYPYGFGWELDDFPPGGYSTGVTSIRHEGTLPGFRAVITRLPKQGLTVVVFTNLDNAMVDSIVAGIAVRYAPEVMPAALRRWSAGALQ